jgi:hypothetical protein
MISYKDVVDNRYRFSGSDLTVLRSETKLCLTPDHVLIRKEREVTTNGRVGQLSNQS